MLRNACASGFLALFIAAPSIHAGLRVDNLSCESLADPISIQTDKPRLSWMVSSSQRDQVQTAYRILVASSEAHLAKEQGDLWDTGKVRSSNTLEITYQGTPLRSAQRCFWKVQAWDAKDEASRWSKQAQWEVGLLLTDSDWGASWISDGKPAPAREEDFYKEDPAPLFRREFQLTKKVRSARLYITGLGYYEAALNGKRIGDHLLDPAWTDYSNRVFYSTYDVTRQLHKGGNCIGVTLGNGWWNPLPMRLFGSKNLRAALPVGRPMFIARLQVDYADGTGETIVSDTSWKVADGPLRFNNVYLGEVYDAQRESRGWDTYGFDAAEWRRASVATAPPGQFQAQPLPPIRGREKFHPVKITTPAPRTFIYDFGQNFAGWAAFKFRATRAGTRIVVRYGELLHKDGTLNPLTSVCGQIKGTRRNSRGQEESVAGPGAPPVAWQQDIYIARGGALEEYIPRFTFHGFRYAEVTGLEQPVALDDVTGFQLGTAVADAGAFECSDPIPNRIQEMCRRTFLANIFSVQSDCPHRERFGYGGDIVASSEAFMMNFNMASFYEKSVHDFADAALPDGMFTDTAPFVGIQYCGVGWAMAHPLLLEQLHRYYGNRRLMEEQFDAAYRWISLVASQYPNGIITNGLSDHEALTSNPPGPLVTPLFYQSAKSMAAQARLLGRPEQASELEELAAKSRAAYLKNYFNAGTGRAEPGTQAGQAFALYTGVVPEESRPKALEFLISNIQRENAGALTTGIMGTKFMLEELSRAGRSDVAFKTVTRTNFPGWGWMLANGATTLWEHWEFSDNTYSHNHPMFGSVSQWFIQWLGGIQPDKDACGFDRIIVRPQAPIGMDWARASYDSVRGPIVSRWERKAGFITYEITIPANTVAEIRLHSSSPAGISEGGAPVSGRPGIKSASLEGPEAVIQVGSGAYRFRCPE